MSSSFRRRRVGRAGVDQFVSAAASGGRGLQPQRSAVARDGGRDANHAQRCWQNQRRHGISRRIFGELQVNEYVRLGFFTVIDFRTITIQITI